MLRWYPMARATSRLAGRPVIYDLSKIERHVRTLPSYQPIVRDLETIRYSIRRKHFGVRVRAELGFTVPWSRAINSVARWYEVDGLDLLLAGTDLTASPWSPSNLSVAPSPAIDPLGTLSAYRLTDSSAISIGVLTQDTPIPAQNSTILFSLFARSDAQHTFNFLVQELSGFDFAEVDVDAEEGWRLQSVRKSFSAAAGNLRVGLRATRAVASQLGDVDIFLPEASRIIAIPGTDEEILADLTDKLSSDDWDVELTLDGGLTWRAVLLEEHEKTPIDDKWVGHLERFAFVASEPDDSVPAARDGAW
jgi:hypothetical protein